MKVKFKYCIRSNFVVPFSMWDKPKSQYFVEASCEIGREVLKVNSDYYPGEITISVTKFLKEDAKLKLINKINNYKDEESQMERLSSVLSDEDVTI